MKRISVKLPCRKSTMRLLLLLFVLTGQQFLLSACTSLAIDTTSATVDKTPFVVPAVDDGDDGGRVQNGWWRVGYHFSWSEDQEPMWYLDPLLAHQVVKPVLDEMNQEIKLWRFHRRAARDATGHQFSFLFYSSSVTAKKVYALLGDNDVVRALKNESLIERLSFSDINSNKKPEIGDSSDKVWSRELQQTWPYFIMGVSQTWLGLIDKFVQQNTFDEHASEIMDKVKRYRQSNEQLTTLWEQQGGHAFLHHLNALFGYQELFVYEKKRVRY